MAGKCHRLAKGYDEDYRIVQFAHEPLRTRVPANLFVKAAVCREYYRRERRGAESSRGVTFTAPGILYIQRG